MNFTFVFVAASFMALGLIFSLIKLLFAYKQKEIYTPDPLGDSEIERLDKRKRFLKLEERVLDFRTMASVSNYFSVFFGTLALIILLVKIAKM